jgi:hypothetical protein
MAVLGKAARSNRRRSKANGRGHPNSPTIILGKRENQLPARQRNDTTRSREYLTPNELERMITAAARQAGGQLAGRDALPIMMLYTDLAPTRFKDFWKD